MSIRTYVYLTAPGSPKIEVASASKRVTTAAAGGQQGIPSSGSSNTVLSHSYFHTLPEEAAVLFELKSSHQDPNQGIIHSVPSPTYTVLSV